MAAIQIPPFAKHAEIVPDCAATQPQEQNIPNEPLLSNTASSVSDFLSRELQTPVLDELSPYLWLIAKKSGSHIDPLHEQVIKQRVLTVTEKPGLHMDTYLTPKRQEQLGRQEHARHYAIASLSANCQAALGLLRSYGCLVCYESDFVLAQQANLIPKDITYAKFQIFIDCFRHCTDEAVAPRYHCGQIRLTRLNYAVRILRPVSTGHRFPWYYQELYWQTGSYIERFTAPLLFIFASMSVTLSAMQVVLAARGQRAWESFSQASWGFSLAVIISNVAIFGITIVMISKVLLSQLLFAVNIRRKEKVFLASNKA
ncbi:MAG: hypothetical protein M1840_008311 [Geoglossum simile]|nr:MAG: hypothetical protein M1840_008311 [Geoglossum simile]